MAEKNGGVHSVHMHFFNWFRREIASKCYKTDITHSHTHSFTFELINICDDSFFLRFCACKGPFFLFLFARGYWHSTENVFFSMALSISFECKKQKKQTKKTKKVYIS